MNSREIVLANMNHTVPPRPGLNFDRGRENDMLIIQMDTPASEVAERWIEADRQYYRDEWGNVWVRMVGGSEKGEIHTPFLTSWDKLDQIRVPDYTDPARYQTMRREFSVSDEKFRVAHIGGWIFDNARYLRKMENYFMDMALHPSELRKLHRIVGDVYEARIRGAGEAGADAIFIGEDMGTQKGLLFSPEMFREYFKADYTRLMGIAHNYGMKVLLHSCGFNWQIIDDLIDAGVDCFQFDQPALYDMPALARKCKDRKVALWSPVDIQKVMPTGDRRYIEEQTQYMLEVFKGFLIAKNYPDLHGIGVECEWDDWAYNTILRICGK